jgi:hypothetical protein
MLETLPGSIEASGWDKAERLKTIANGKRICYILFRHFKQLWVRNREDDSIGIRVIIYTNTLLDRGNNVYKILHEPRWQQPAQ